MAKKSIMSLDPCCVVEVATLWLVLAVGTSGKVGSEGSLGDIEEAKIIEY